MGMPSASVQPGTQPQGKGFAQPFNPPQSQQPANTQSYFDANPDVAQSYQQNNYGMTPDQFSQTHYQKFGQAEQRLAPGQQPQTGQPMGKGGRVTSPITSGQPRMGQPNMYPNTVGQWDNASIQPQQRQMRGGKGKGA